MPACPRCEKPVSVAALKCPHCNLTLKAHGHPGMTLYRGKAEPLCATCAYDADNTCTFPKRPDAMTCTLYQDVNSTSALPSAPYSAPPRPWWKENLVWIALGVLIALSIAFAL